MGCSGYNEFWSFICEFQTLIAGALAIFGGAFALWSGKIAANATDLANRRSIAEQQRQAAADAEAERERDRRRLETLANFVDAELQNYIDDAKDIEEAFEYARNDIADNRRLRKFVREIDEPVNVQVVQLSWADIVGFPPEVVEQVRHFHFAHQKLASCIKNARQSCEALPSPDPAQGHLFRGLALMPHGRHDVDEVLGAAQFAADDAHDHAEQLKVALANHFAIHAGFEPDRSA
jgi:hypothetical protein